MLQVLLNLSIPQTRQGAKLLQGNPELVRNIANSLPFKHTYTTGALSFNETADSITDEQKWDLPSNIYRQICRYRLCATRLYQKDPKDR